jgi:ABC-type transport system substrate-binding protein
MEKEETMSRLYTKARRALMLSLTMGLVLASCAAPVVTQPPPTSAPVAVAPTAAPAAAACNGGKLVLALTVDVFRFDPYDLAIGNMPMLNTVYDSLVHVGADLQPNPWLAKSWEFSSDGKHLTLHLQEGVLFENGREMVADDVAWTIQQFQDPANAANINKQTLLITSTTVDDPHTITLNFDAPFPAIFDILELLFVVNKDGVATIKNQPAGTGPFRLAEWVPGDHARYVRNPDYWRKGEPCLDEIVQQVFSDQQAMVAALEAGTVDLVMFPTVQDFLRLKDNKSYVATAIPGFAEVNVNFNTKNKPWDNKLVRQAVNHAIDRERFIQVAFQGLGEPICQPVRSGWAHNPAVDDSCKFDLNLAKQLLVQAGYPDGFKAEALVSTAVMPESTTLATMMKEDLAKIGIDLSILDLEQTAYNNTGDNSLYKDIYIQGVGRTKKDPGVLFGATVAFRPVTNVAQFRNAEYESLQAQGNATTDPTARQKIYYRIAEILTDECFSLVLTPRMDLFLMKPQVQNFGVSRDTLVYTGQLAVSK